MVRVRRKYREMGGDGRGKVEEAGWAKGVKERRRWILRCCRLLGMTTRVFLCGHDGLIEEGSTSRTSFGMTGGFLLVGTPRGTQEHRTGLKTRHYMAHFADFLW